ncbi:transmembrane protein [Cystoisospora suis]|uniref:Transmembrane protein n=1 Tax=Cystoisospora suis TaxID=483139 RepID=A0A2C6L0G8_9APIC|nr:transmembrane protein [Cystoisospora suis]
MERHNGRLIGGKGDAERQKELKEEQLRFEQEEGKDEPGEGEEDQVLKRCSYIAAVEVTRTLLGEEDSKTKGIFRLSQQLAFTEGGFLCSSFRAVLFPILLGCSSPCLTSWGLLAFLRARQLLLRELKPKKRKKGERVRRRFTGCGSNRGDCQVTEVKEEKQRDNITSHRRVANTAVAGSSDSVLEARVKRRETGKEGRGQESFRKKPKKTGAPIREVCTGGELDEDDHNKDKVAKEAIQSHLYMCAWTGLTRCLERSSPVSSYLSSCCLPGSQPSLPERKEMERKISSEVFFSENKNEHVDGAQRRGAIASTKGRKKEIYDMLRRGMTEYKGAELIVFFVTSFEETSQLSSLCTRGGAGVLSTLIPPLSCPCPTGVETESGTRRQEKLKDGGEGGGENWASNNSNTSFAYKGNEEREGEKGRERNGDEELTFLIDSLQRAGIRSEVRNESPLMEKAKMASSFLSSSSSSPHVSYPSRHSSPVFSSSGFSSLFSFYLKRPSSTEKLLAEKRAWEAEGYHFLPEAERAQIRKDVVRSMRQWRLPEEETQGFPQNRVFRRLERGEVTVHDARQIEKESSAEEMIHATNKGEGSEVGSSLMIAKPVVEEMERQCEDSMKIGEAENSTSAVDSRLNDFTSAGPLSRDIKESSYWSKEEEETRQFSPVGASVEKITTQFEDQEEEIEGKTGVADEETREEQVRERSGEGDYRGRRRKKIEAVQDISEKRTVEGEEVKDERTVEGEEEEGRNKNEKVCEEEMENGEGGDEDVICLRDTLEKILSSVVARHYSRLFYTQGMHDIAGAILLLLMHAGRFLLLAFQVRKGRSSSVGNLNMSSSSSSVLDSIWPSHHLTDFLFSSSSPSSSLCSFSSLISSYPSLVAYLSSLAFSLTERLYLFHLCDFFAASLEASLLPALSLLSLFLCRYDPSLHTVFSCASIAAIDEKSSQNRTAQITGRSQKEEESESSQEEEDDDDSVGTVTSSTDSFSSEDEENNTQDNEENEEKEEMQTTSEGERDYFCHHFEEEKHEDVLMNEGSSAQALSTDSSSSSSFSSFFLSAKSSQVAQPRRRRRQLGDRVSSRSSSSLDVKKKKDGERSARRRIETREMPRHSDTSSSSGHEGEKDNRSAREEIIKPRSKGKKKGKKEIHKRENRRFSTETSTSLRFSTPSAFSPVSSSFPEEPSPSCSSSSLPHVSSPFRSSGLEFQPCTSWLITFFAHSFSSFSSLCRYLDCALTSHPLFSLHFAAVVISFHRMQIFQAFEDLLEASINEGEFLPEELENFLTSLRQRQTRRRDSSLHRMQRRDSRKRGGERETHSSTGGRAEAKENSLKKIDEMSATDEESLVSRFDRSEERTEEKEEKISARRERWNDVCKEQKRRRKAEERCELKKEEEEERGEDQWKEDMRCRRKCLRDQQRSVEKEADRMRAAVKERRDDEAFETRDFEGKQRETLMADRKGREKAEEGETTRGGGEEEKNRDDDDDVMPDVTEEDALRGYGELVARKLMEDQWGRLSRQEEELEREMREEEGRRSRRLFSFLRFREKKGKDKDLIPDRGLLEQVRDRLGDSISVKLHSIIQNIHFDALPLDDLLHETYHSSFLDEDSELSVHLKEILRQAKHLNIRLPPFSPVYNYPYPWMETKKKTTFSSSFPSRHLSSFLPTSSATSLGYPLDILHHLPPPPSEENQEYRSDFYQSSGESLKEDSSFSCEGSRGIYLSKPTREETNQSMSPSFISEDHPNRVSSGNQASNKDEAEIKCEASQRNELNSASVFAARTQEDIFSPSSFSSSSALETSCSFFTIPPPYLYLPTTGEDPRVPSSEEECQGSLKEVAEASNEAPQRQKRANRSSLAKNTVKKYPSHWVCVYNKVSRHGEEKKKRHSHREMKKKELTLKRQSKSVMLSPSLVGRSPSRALVWKQEEERERNGLMSIVVWIFIFFLQPLVTLCQWILDLFFVGKESDGFLPSVTHTTMMRECQRRMRSLKYEKSSRKRTVEKRDKKKKE